jgi:hypothetical protein
VNRVVPDTGVRGTGLITDGGAPEGGTRRLASVETWRDRFPEPSDPELEAYLLAHPDRAARILERLRIGIRHRRRIVAAGPLGGPVLGSVMQSWTGEWHWWIPVTLDLASPLPELLDAPAWTFGRCAREDDAWSELVAALEARGWAILPAPPTP